MVNKTNRNKPIDAGVPLRPDKDVFAQKIYQLRMKKGWSQADLHRASGLPRDAISVYELGKSLPTEASLKKLAKALDVDPKELMPARVLAHRDKLAMFEIKTIDTPGRVLLRVNQEVDLAVALKIAELLNAKTTS